MKPFFIWIIKFLCDDLIKFVSFCYRLHNNLPTGSKGYCIGFSIVDHVELLE